MSARLTVVLDDEDLYRRLKVKAAEDGVPMKDLVESGLRMVLNDAPGASEPVAASGGKEFSWERYEEMMRQWEEEDRKLGRAADYPTNLSDIKHHLYGYPPQPGPAERALRIAEERMEYDPQ